jgi:phosphinothricin acetyltransferase
MSYTLEPLAEVHRKAVIDIFNHYVAHSFAAYPEAAVGYEVFDRFVEMSTGYPAVVATTETGEVVGFAFLRPFHHADTFKRTAEIAYFILREHTGKGLGRAILDRFIEQARKMGVDNFLASISSRNPESLEFHRQQGFKECGRFQEVGRKFGESFDVVWMQRRI